MYTITFYIYIYTYIWNTPRRNREKKKCVSFMNDRRNGGELGRNKSERNKYIRDE